MDRPVISLRRRVLSAIRWTAGAQLAGKALRGVITLYVIRILEPADYGLVATAVVVTELAAVFANLGLNVALIQNQRLDEVIISKIFGAVLVSSAVLFAIVQALAAPYAAFYSRAGLEDVVRVAAFVLPIGAVGAVPAALLTRDLEFRPTAALEFVGAATSSLLILTLALAGWGVWALVAGLLFSALVHALGMLAVTRFRIRPQFDFSGISKELRFGATMVAKSIVSTLAQKIDVVVGGRMMGVDLVGAYSVGGDLAKTPSRALLRPITQVTFPATARLQAHREGIRQMFLAGSTAVLFVLLPLSWGLSAIADELIALLLGAKWAAAAPALVVLGLAVPLRSTARLLQTTLDGIGRADIALKNLITTALCLPPVLVVGATWGVLGLSVGWAVAHLLAMIANMRRSLDLVGVTRAELARSLAPVLASAAVMYGAVLSLKSILPPDLPLALRLALLVVAGAAAYAAASFLLNRRVLVSTVRSVWS